MVQFHDAIDEMWWYSAQYIGEPSEEFVSKRVVCSQKAVVHRWTLSCIIVSGKQKNFQPIASGLMAFSKKLFSISNIN